MINPSSHCLAMCQAHNPVMTTILIAQIISSNNHKGKYVYPSKFGNYINEIKTVCLCKEILETRKKKLIPLALSQTVINPRS